MKRRLLTLLPMALALAALHAGEVRGQERPGLLVEGPDGGTVRIPLNLERGWPSLDADGLQALGWTVYEDQGVARARSTAPRDLLFRAGNPWVRWGDQVLQLAHAPFYAWGTLHVPVQVAVDLLPRMLPDVYSFDSEEGMLRVHRRPYWKVDLARAQIQVRPPAARTLPTPGALPSPGTAPSDTPGPSAPAPLASRRVVVIDPGHGGRDPGALGRRGLREKDVALGIARALARELRADTTLEVYLTREKDALVPIWERGELATRWKGERPGVFISLHANSLRSSSTRGFETYFLSEARTDHERRVAANENAPLALRGDQDVEELHRDPDLAFILKDLRNEGHQHWSELLAEMVQEEMAPIHPGPNRGVKQAPLAVITNALMPAVLVEVGFISNPQEEALLGQNAFRDRAAAAMANAVQRFFRRYPPGSAAGRVESRP